jgi:hypothetical protein
MITGNDPFKEDELMKWNIIRFLNRLQFEYDHNQAMIIESKIAEAERKR